MTFLGTSSQGGACRYPSSLALRLRGSHSSEVWIFDAGEGSIAQLQRSYMRVGAVRNIFVTHVHGDHLYGLPGLVLSILARRNVDEENAVAAPPLRVFGPPGVRSYLRMALGVASSCLRLKNALQINEIQLPSDLPSARYRGRRAAPYWKTRVRKLPLEVWPRDIAPETAEDGSVTYPLLGHGLGGGRYTGDGTPASVVAAPVAHTVPCFAYCVREHVIENRFDKSKLAALNVPNSSDINAYSLFQSWLRGESASWDGRLISPEEVLEPGRRPRRVCIVGDTHDASGAAHIASDVDVLVHEATNMAAQTHIARRRGHSSTRDATAFAKRVGAKRLLLNHTSVAYSEPKLRALEAEARALFGMDSVYVTRDLSVFNVPTEFEDTDEFVFRRFVGFTAAADCWRQRGLVPNDQGELVRDGALAPLLPELFAAREDRETSRAVVEPEEEVEMVEEEAVLEEGEQDGEDSVEIEDTEDCDSTRMVAEELGLQQPPTAAACNITSLPPPIEVRLHYLLIRTSYVTGLH